MGLRLALRFASSGRTVGDIVSTEVQYAIPMAHVSNHNMAWRRTRWAVCGLEAAVIPNSGSRQKKPQQLGERALSIRSEMLQKHTKIMGCTAVVLVAAPFLKAACAETRPSYLNCGLLANLP